jgi:hypothetical protein
MASGKEHYIAWKRFFPMLAGFSFLLALMGYWYLSIWVVVGYLLHGKLGITNDLDLISINQDEAMWIRTIVLIPLVMWSTFYARIMQGLGGHRSFWSHSFGVSTFIRLMFFGFPFILVFRYFFTDPIYYEFFGMFIGLSIADGIHIIMDWRRPDG